MKKYKCIKDFYINSGRKYKVEKDLIFEIDRKIDLGGIVLKEKNNDALICITTETFEKYFKEES